MNAGRDHINWWRTIGWAFYLACSWTWCIGMFLPVLLVRDYGVWGFVIFAVPNVIGAGAMGWVLRGPGASERILREHRLACACFSWVTIAFQLFWLTQMRPWMPVEAWTAMGWWGAVVAAGIVLSIVTADARWSVVGVASALVWGLSVLALGGLGRRDSQADGFLAYRPETMWLAPVMAFGFALCPYLDVTFHRVRREARGVEGPAAFTIGFGVFFLAMIVMTLGYSSTLLMLPSGGPIPSLTAHWIVQALFTIAAHLTPVAVGLEGLRRAGSAAEHARLRKRTTMLVAAVAGVALAGVFLLPGFDLSRLSDAEVVYRCFMGFYGLVFPAYVWLLMIPTRDGHSGLMGEAGRRKLLIWAGAVGIAAPMFWMGFIRQQEFWLVPGLGVVLFARLVMPRGRLANLRTGERVEL